MSHTEQKKPYRSSDLDDSDDDEYGLVIDENAANYDMPPKDLSGLAKGKLESKPGAHHAKDEIKLEKNSSNDAADINLSRLNETNPCRAASISEIPSNTENESNRRSDENMREDIASLSSRSPLRKRPRYIDQHTVRIPAPQANSPTSTTFHNPFRRESDDSKHGYDTPNAINIQDYKYTGNTQLHDELLLRESGQTNIQLFNNLAGHYGWDGDCTKLGEGNFGDVYCCYDKNLRTQVAIKVLPTGLVRDIDEIATEIDISKRVSQLSEEGHFQTSAFIKLHRLHYVVGKYPDSFIGAYNEHDKTETVRSLTRKHPNTYRHYQTFVLFVYELGGRPLEDFEFSNPNQVFSMFHQIVSGLAVAGEKLSFVHNDLHQANILVSSANVPDTLHYRLRGVKHEIPTHGVCVKIIDFSHSQISKDLYNVGQTRDLLAVYMEMDLFGERFSENDFRTITEDHRKKIDRLRDSSPSMWDSMMGLLRRLFLE